MRDIKKYPFVKQNDFKDCGICSLQMVISYYKGYVGKEKLREMTKTDNDGTTAYHLVECLKELGFNSSGVSCSITDFHKNNLTLPCIAHVTINNSYNHYVVIYSINDKKQELVIADPAEGIKKVSFSDFEKIFNNILIILFPIKTVPIMYKEDSFYKFILKVLVEHRKYYIKLFLISLVLTFFAVIGTLYWRFIINALNSSISTMYVIFLLFFIIKLSELTINFFRNKIIIVINQKVSFSLTTNIFDKIVSLPYHYYRNRTTGEMIARINDLDIIRDVINKFILTIVIDLFLTILSGYFLFHINQILFVISFMFVVINSVIIYLFRKKLRLYINKVQSSNADLNSYMVETITGFETVKGLGFEEVFSNNFNSKYKSHLLKILKFDCINNIKDFISNLFNEMGIYIIILVGMIFAKKGYITLGDLLVFQILFNYFLTPIKTLLEMDTIIEEANNSYKRISEIIPYNSKKYKVLNNSFQKIDFKNVYYTKDDQNYILKDITFDINHGEKIMIVGNSGVGKSTILKLLKGYYQSSKGNIKIDGKNIKEYSKSDIDNNIIYISQNEFLFTDSIFNNITLKEEVSEDNFNKVCNECLVSNVVENKPLSYHTILEENGFNISGGEKQRIILARSLLRNFEIMLIDEGFSQLDVNLERKILKNIFTNYRDKTFVIISHRLDNVDLFDKMIEVKDGMINKIVMRNGEIDNAISN